MPDRFGRGRKEILLDWITIGEVGVIFSLRLLGTAIAYVIGWALFGLYCAVHYALWAIRTLNTFCRGILSR